MSWNHQETLDEKAPLIIDVTCSFRHKDLQRPRWPKFASLRMDIRAEVKPDVVADARFLPLRDHCVDQFACDPPFLMRSPTPEGLQKIRERRRREGRTTPDPFTMYGHWKSRKEWLDFVEKSDAEFARCLKKNGLLHYKIMDNKDGRDTKAADLDLMRHFVVAKRKIRISKGNLGNPNGNTAKHPNVQYLVMKPTQI